MMDRRRQQGSSASVLAMRALLGLGCLAGAAQGIFYLPGVAPRSYEKGESVRLYVNKLTSTKTQMPFDYYSLPYCHPKKIQEESENLGEVLSGDRIEKNTLYELNFKVPAQCQTVCRVVLGEKEKKQFIKAIDQDYRVHWIVDNLPGATKVKSELRTDDVYYVRGFPVGAALDGKHFLFNHIKLVISYNEDHSPEAQRKFKHSRIVGFLVEPYSIKHSYEGTWPTDPDAAKAMQYTSCVAGVPPVNDQRNLMTLEDNGEVVFTYDVEWVEDSHTVWAHRWDVYLKGDPND